MSLRKRREKKACEEERDLGFVFGLGVVVGVALLPFFYLTCGLWDFVLEKEYEEKETCFCD